MAREFVASSFGQHVLLHSGAGDCVAVCVHLDLDAGVVETHSLFYACGWQVVEPLEEEDAEPITFREWQRAALESALRQAGNRTQAAAHILGVAARTVRSWRQREGI